MELPFDERLAMHGEPMPKKLPLTDQKLYIALRGLYQQYHSGALNREQASREKKLLIDAWQSDKSIDDQTLRIAALWKRIEPRAQEYTTAPSQETADRFYAAVYNLRENWRNDRTTVREGAFE